MILDPFDAEHQVDDVVLDVPDVPVLAAAELVGFLIEVLGVVLALGLLA